MIDLTNETIEGLFFDQVSKYCRDKNPTSLRHQAKEKIIAESHRLPIVQDIWQELGIDEVPLR